MLWVEVRADHLVRVESHYAITGTRAGATQPPKANPLSAVAVRVTTLPNVYRSSHLSPQSIPEGLLVTVPVPLPSLFHTQDGSPTL